MRYGAVAAVRGLSLRLEQGEIVGLIGPNGAGKSTTLHAIMGAVPVAAGEILLRGSALRGQPEDIARSGVALVPEGRHIFGSLTVDENLRLGLAGRRTKDGVAEDLDWVRGLFPVVAEFSSRHAGSLSGGQQQQLAIARALVARPDVLLLDEPSLGLAPKIVETLFETLGPDPRPRRDDPARRAARRDDDRVRRPHSRPLERRAQADARTQDAADPAELTRRLSHAYLS